MPPFVARPARHLSPTPTSIEVIARFVLRMMVLVLFAAFGHIGFQQSFAVLLWMSAILSAALATFDRDQPFDLALNHWDETAAYAALCSLICAFSPPAQWG
ncbi:MAG TPA: hypothetical protein VKT76_02510 [Bradyrhizobium sp.]|nr:hypothetical protein [Bradyrhizobium sp.]